MILYLTAIEDVFTSGIVHSQVVPLLEGLSERHHIQTALVSIVPVHRVIRGRHARATLAARLARSRVPLIIHPVVTRGQVYLRPSALASLRHQVLGRLTRTATNLDPTLIHARSYPATHLAAALPRPYIFDGRGLYREEALRVGAWRRHSDPDRFWAREETRLASAASAVVGVSDHFTQVFPSDRTTIIPCFAEDTVQETGPLPERLTRLLDAAPVLVYAGSLTSWYDPETLFRLFAHVVGKTRWNVLVLTGDVGPASALQARLALPPDRVVSMHLPHRDVMGVLRSASAAIWVVFEPPSELFASQLGVKFAEYAAAGLPLLVSSTLDQAAALVSRYEAGIVLAAPEAGLITDALTRIEAEGTDMGRGARAMYEASFTRADAVDAYAALYETVRTGVPRA